MTEITAGEAREDFAATLRRARRGERFVVSSRGKPVAAIVPIEDLGLIQAIEDKIDREAVRESPLDRDEPIPWEEAKGRLGID